jgi:hypothetical protein
MAHAEAELTSELGVALVTAGPGVTRHHGHCQRPCGACKCVGVVGYLSHSARKPGWLARH